ncbi:MAG: isocitrate/isopropylmalate dehydrogenase family protein [Deltaproteobacteria bacterium]|nr:isocitrate/isopropylmalate dehydrogenase family protein [Deltaproteobacteria bacterium]
MCHRIAVIPGDGVGREVVAEGLKALDALAAGISGLAFEYTMFDWGSERHLREGAMMPADGLDLLRRMDAIYLGAVGDPRLPDHVTLHGLLLPIKMGFDLYVGLRPACLYPGVTSVLAGKKGGEIDLVVVRENTEGEYADLGGIVGQGGQETAVQAGLFTRRGVERIVRFAFELARTRRRLMTSVTKSNAQKYGMVLWDRVVREVAAEFPDVTAESRLVDAAAMDLVRRPEHYDVSVASNLFADILSDLAAGITGGMGVAPGASFRRDRGAPGLFDPVHGSAPDIAGQGLANPVAAILTARMMLEYLGEAQAAEVLHEAVRQNLREGRVRTPDLGGSASTAEVGDDIARRVQELLTLPDRAS